MTDSRALELYRLAVSLVEAKGHFETVGVLTYKEFRGEGLAIRYFPGSGTLELWHKCRVLLVNRYDGELWVRQYLPGKWESLLGEAAQAS